MVLAKPQSDKKSDTHNTVPQPNFIPHPGGYGGGFPVNPYGSVGGAGYGVATTGYQQVFSLASILFFLSLDVSFHLITCLILNSL